MSSAASAPPGLLERGARTAARAVEGRRQRRVEADGAGAAPALDRRGARARSARGADPPGLLLRHARARSRRPRRGRPRAANPGQGRRLDRQAAPGDAERAAGGAAAVGRIPRRGGRAPRWLRLLRDAQGLARRGRRAQRGQRDAPAAEALLEGAAAALSRRTRRRGSALDDLTVLGPIFVLKLRLDAAGASVAGSWRRCGSTRTAPASSSCRRARATKEAFQVAAETRAYPRRARRRSLGRAGDEDAQGARVLRARAREA